MYIDGENLQLGPAIPGDAEISVDQQLLLMLSKEARVQKGPGKTLRLKLAAQVPEIFLPDVYDSLAAHASQWLKVA